MSQRMLENAAATVLTINALTPSQIPAHIELLIALHLNLWSALTLAIQNGWGTSSPQVGAEKREWLAGAISDLFTQNQLRDLDDLEEVLENVMIDEFEVEVDDGSLEDVARMIWRGRERLLTGDAAGVRELLAVWEERQKKGGDKVVGVLQRGDDEDGGEEGEEEWNGFQDMEGDVDVDMDDAPALVDASKEKKRVEPEVDEDGFTKVIGKKKR